MPLAESGMNPRECPVKGLGYTEAWQGPSPTPTKTLPKRSCPLPHPGITLGVDRGGACWGN